MPYLEQYDAPRTNNPEHNRRLTPPELGVRHREPAGSPCLFSVSPATADPGPGEPPAETGIVGPWSRYDFPVITKIRGLAAATLALPLLAAATPAVAQPDTPHVSKPVAEAIAALPVADESRAGYKRTAFRHWVDADHDGCNTRAEVLIEEAVEKPTVGKGCKFSGGRWHSYYDEKDTTNSRSLDIDHMVPLAEAWDSGASAWSAEKRTRYANDLDWSRSLVAVTAKYNRQKGDRDPSDWWVPAKSASCTYLADWVGVKTRWGLSVDQAERAALRKQAGQCPDAVVDVPLAR